MLEGNRASPSRRVAASVARPRCDCSRARSAYCSVHDVGPEGCVDDRLNFGQAIHRDQTLGELVLGNNVPGKRRDRLAQQRLSLHRAPQRIRQQRRELGAGNNVPGKRRDRLAQQRLSLRRAPQRIRQQRRELVAGIGILRIAPDGFPSPARRLPARRRPSVPRATAHERCLL